MRGWVAKAAVQSCVDLQAVGTLEFFYELYSLAKGFGPFLPRGFGQALEKGRVLFLVTTRHMRSCMPSPRFVDKPLIKLKRRLYKY